MTDLLAAAKPWHYWISYVLFVLALLGLVATGVGYYIKVISNKYPKE